MIIELTSRGRPAAALKKTALEHIEAWAAEGYGYEDIAARLDDAGQREAQAIFEGR